MHIGKSYGGLALLRWTRRKAYLLGANALLVVGLYQAAGWRWVALPWPVLALLGTAASFIVGFKNVQTYGRTLEAQQIWSAITAASRYWGLIGRDLAGHAGAARELLERHLAWLTAVRYQLRAPRIWEGAARGSNAEYRAGLFYVPEHAVPLETELVKYMPPGEAAALVAAGSVAQTLVAMQSRTIRALFDAQQLPLLHHAEMQKTLKELIDQHARAERIKNFPYPRQYAIVNTVFVWVFALLLPYSVVREFAQLQIHMTWLAVPFSVLVGWMYVALDQVGESTENPFEGGANDVPITHLCRCIEADLRALLGEPGALPMADEDAAIVL